MRKKRPGTAGTGRIRRIGRARAAGGAADLFFSSIDARRGAGQDRRAKPRKNPRFAPPAALFSGRKDQRRREERKGSHAAGTSQGAALRADGRDRTRQRTAGPARPLFRHRAEGDLPVLPHLSAGGLRRGGPPHPAAGLLCPGAADRTRRHGARGRPLPRPATGGLHPALSGAARPHPRRRAGRHPPSRCPTRPPTRWSTSSPPSAWPPSRISAFSRTFSPSIRAGWPGSPA